MIKVNITALYKLIVNKELVPTDILATESKALYKALKLEGGKHVGVYFNADGQHRVDLKVFDSDIRIRAMAALITKIMYRWNDDNDRLEHHFGLPTSISSILDIEGITKSGSKNDDYNYITVRTLAENYTGKKYQHTSEEW